MNLSSHYIFVYVKRKPQKGMEILLLLMTRFKSSDPNHCQCLEYWFPLGFEPAQISFETALEILVEIANMRSTMLATFDQVHEELEDTQR
ncbi:hypothetical protein Patl1_09374 [Pistacia atlantica]|uniref:Uncharacterized protein n=1 Tax=Pistacia atlantica TaxID=434234 RepID=A0ACC1AJC7_9ROSI|nr:hypothetical protein Patl1_09374 [Pistacia atlantica]